MEISNFFATFGIKVDPKELKKIDMLLLAMERKIKAWEAKQKTNSAFRIGNFRIDQRRLNLSLGNALDAASARVVFQVSRFDVHDRNLRAALTRAGRRNRDALGIGLAGGGLGGYAGGRGPGGGGLGNRRGAFHDIVGGGLGMMGMRPYGQFAAGGVLGYMGFRGLAALNRRNQEIMSGRIATRSVTSMFGGTTEQGNAAFDWLRSEGNRLGFSYMGQVSGYNNFLANALGTGMSMGSAQDIFRGFTEFGKVKGIDPARRKLVNQALGQMMGKGVLSMEELKRQMSESLPGTMPIFAAAYQQMTGGNLEGQKAIAKLLEDVPKGNIKSAEILPIVAQIMSQRAQSGLTEAVRTSQSEQERFINTVDDLLILAQPKTERAFSRLFRTFSDGLNRSTPLAMELVDYFDSATIIVEGMGDLFGEIVFGWSELNQLVKGTDIGFGKINMGLGEMSVAAAALLTPFTRIASIVTAAGLFIDDAMQTVKGNPNTFTWDMMRAGGGFFEGPMLKYQRRQREQLNHQIITETNPKRFNELLQQKKEVSRLELRDPSFTPTAGQRLLLHERGLDEFGRAYGKIDYATGQMGGQPLSPERLAYLKELEQIEQSEARYENMLFKSGYSPQKAQELGNIFTKEARKQAISDYRSGKMEIKADIKVTGETTEEAMNKVKEQITEVLEEANREALTQFPDNEN